MATSLTCFQETLWTNPRCRAERRGKDEIQSLQACLSVCSWSVILTIVFLSARPRPKDADVVLDDKSFVTEHRSAILQALDNMYDDEYDDTYDSMGLNNTGADFKLVDDIDAKADDTVARHTVGRAQMVCGSAPMLLQVNVFISEWLVCSLLILSRFGMHYSKLILLSNTRRC